MIIGEYILLGLLLVCALFIVIAVTLQKSGDEGLSGAISGGSDTYYGKDKSANKEKLLGKWTLIATVIFALAVIAVFVIQPDYDSSSTNYESWKEIISEEYKNAIK